MYKYIIKFIAPKLLSVLMMAMAGIIGGISAYTYKQFSNPPPAETHQVEISVHVDSDTLIFKAEPLIVKADTARVSVDVNVPERIEIIGPELLPVTAATRPDEKELTCLAQAAFSETDRPHEQLAVAWAVRNRVESNRFPDTYCGVAFQKAQFSGLNRGDNNYKTNVDIPKNASKWLAYPENDYRGKAANRYLRALKIAETVMLSDTVMDVCPGATHFWSPVVYHKGIIRWPSWAKNVVADCVIRDRGTKTLRFAFYKNIL